MSSYVPMRRRHERAAGGPRRDVRRAEDFAPQREPHDRSPFIFPSLGPTAFLLFYSPLQPTACPRNTLCGHLIGVVAGYFSLVTFGLVDAGPAFVVGMSWARVGAVALSLGLTAGIMVWLRVPHPPAGATTLIVSLGLITSIPKLVVLMLGVMLLVIQGFAINRLAGVPYPIWSPRPAPA